MLSGVMLFAAAVILLIVAGLLFRYCHKTAADGESFLGLLIVLVLPVALAAGWCFLEGLKSARAYDTAGRSAPGTTSKAGD